MTIMNWFGIAKEDVVYNAETRGIRMKDIVRRLCE
jgi:hypothetical protein